MIVYQNDIQGWSPKPFVLAQMEQVHDDGSIDIQLVWYKFYLQRHSRPEISEKS